MYNTFLNEAKGTSLEQYLKLTKTQDKLKFILKKMPRFSNYKISKAKYGMNVTGSRDAFYIELSDHETDIDYDGFEIGGKDYMYTNYLMHLYDKKNPSLALEEIDLRGFFESLVNTHKILNY